MHRNLRCSFGLLAALLLAWAVMLAGAQASFALGLPPVNTGSPAITPDPAQQGQTVTCSSGTWTFFGSPPDTYAYSWQRNGSNIAGQTSSTYTLTAADVSQLITCQVVASDSNGSSPLPATSLPITPLAPPVGLIPVETSLPTIYGTAQQGQTVTCSPGSWLNNPTSYSYSWQNDGSNISGQTGSSYTLSSADVNQLITCTVVAHNASGDSLPAISAPVIPAVGSATGGGPNGGGSQGGGSGGSGGGGSGGAGGGGAKLHRPSLKAFWLAPRKVVIHVRGKRRSTTGTTFHYTVDQKAGLVIEIQRRLAGRRHGRSCVAVTPRNAKAKRCTRWVTVKVLKVRSARPGSGKLRFAGRIGRHLLATGAYRVRAAAVSSAGWSRVRSASFRVVTKRAR